MKYIIIIIFLFILLPSYGQKNKMGVFIPKDDASSFRRSIKYMWVGGENPIAPISNGSSNVIKLWTDNGTVENVDFDPTEYAIIPKIEGKVNVYSLQKVSTANGYDTVNTKNTFIAILPPQIVIKVTNDKFKSDSSISFALINKETMESLPKRYQVGRMYEPKVYDSNGKFIGNIILCYGNTIVFNGPFNKGLKVESGYQIRFTVTVRDNKTDLLISTEEVSYTLK